MANNAKNKQKKLAKQKKKRMARKKSLNVTKTINNKPLAYVQFPIHECLVPDRLFTDGIGTVLVSRRIPDGSLALSAFVVDPYCLGVKNAMFRVLNEASYENELKPSLFNSHEGQIFESVHPSCTKKIINGAVSYAKALGFSPHKDYHNAIKLLGNIESEACSIAYQYGKDGKPFYVSGPNESPAQAQKIVKQLDEKCGTGNYHHISLIG